MPHRYIPLFFFTVCCLFYSSDELRAQSGDKNYVLSRQYKQANLNETNGSSYAGTAQQVTTHITYVDGLGKTSQQVQAFATPNKTDIVSLQTYDNQHRPQRAYLPAPFSDAGGGYRSGVEGKATDYYSNAANVESTTNQPYVETSYEPSPLNRVSEQKAPGVVTGVKTFYKVNEANIVRFYTSSGNGLTDIKLDGGYYAAGTLTQTETQDENSKTVQKYTDRYGRVVLSRVSDQNLSTYYVYDTKGQLRAVLQPQFENNRNVANLTNYAFLYRYDGQGRLVEKYVPGGGSASMSYQGDTDLLTASTDGRGNKFYYFYDGQRRQTEMGFCVGGDCGDRQAMVKTTYDSYPGWGGYDFSNTYGLTASDFVNDGTRGNRKGLVTAMEIRVLLPDLDTQGKPQFGSWLRSVTYYDDKYRVIQVRRQLYGVGGPSLETVSYKLDFMGKVVQERTEQQTSQGTYQLEKSHEYDHMDRLTKISHQVKENGNEKRVTYTHVEQSYNGIGLPAQKRLHGGTAQILNYRYTPRSWIGKINNPAEDYRLTLSYDANGNVNNLGWKTGGSNEGSFSLGYDGANRLTSANGSPLKETIGYDANGNIMSLNRWRNDGQIDGLTYSYEGNRLKKVTDGTGNSDGFNNGGSGNNDDYDYDGNGNLIRDANRGIDNDNISYNLLNLTRRVVVNGKVVKYIYDGAGQKLAQQVEGTNALTVYYAGGFEYDANGQLQRIGLEEGQLRRQSTGTYEVEYYLRDHLGNVRSVVQENSTVVQQTAYYPFGLAVPTGGDANRNKYLYNGKEKQEETGWLDYGARMYTPEIGRWMSVDPLSDFAQNQSPFSYVTNNPLLFIDPFGEDTVRASSANSPNIKKGDIILFDNGTTSTASTDEVSVRGKRYDASSSNEPRAGEYFYGPRTGIWDNLDQFWNGDRTYKYLGHNYLIDSDGYATGSIKPIGGSPPLMDLMSTGGPTFVIKGTQIGLRNPKVVHELMEAMLKGEFGFASKAGKIGGYVDSRGIYYVGEGHHRMAAAMEIYRKTGNYGYVKELISNGVWTKTASAPAGARSLPGLDMMSRFRNWLGF